MASSGSRRHSFPVAAKRVCTAFPPKPLGSDRIDYTTVISNIPVSFPFPPYDTQVNYMKAVIQALNAEEHALIESPTGTGKTLSLLCATIAWVAHHTSSPCSEMEGLSGLKQKHEATDKTTCNGLNTPRPQILFVSRTHAQLLQAVNALKNTSYRTISRAVLGSRDQLCVNNDVYDNGRRLQSGCLGSLCRQAVEKGSCMDFAAFNDIREASAILQEAAAVDIEDVAQTRAQRKHLRHFHQPVPCPYYISRRAAEYADIVFLPYSYLFDVITRCQSQKLLKLKNSIVIVDEGHNLAETCENAASFELSLNNLLSTKEKIHQHLNRTSAVKLEETGTDSDDQRTVSRVDLHNLCHDLCAMHTALGALPPTESGKPILISHILSEIEKNTNISYNNVAKHINCLRFIVHGEQMEENPDDTDNSDVEEVRIALIMLYFPHGPKMSSSGDLSTAKARSKNKDNATEFHASYLVTVGTSKQNLVGGKDNVVIEKILRCLCLSPKNALQGLANEGIRSLIVTSGTLSPLKLLESELGISFKIQFSCDHVISPSQVAGFVIEEAPLPAGVVRTQMLLTSGKRAFSDRDVLTSPTSVQRLKGNYENRDNVLYRIALGNAIVRCISVIPGGVLAFFPSYAAMDNCLAAWHAATSYPTIVSQIQQIKRVFVEQRDKDSFGTDILAYRKTVFDSTTLQNAQHSTGTNNGAIFFAVFRGKISEGINLSDEYARAVLILGIPYMNYQDDRVVLKKIYYDQQRRLNKGHCTMSGHDWYVREAWVSINQAVGRAIRHRSDFGVCIFFDDRFAIEAELPGQNLNSPRNLSTRTRNLPKYFPRILVQPLAEATQSIERFFQLQYAEMKKS